MNDATARWSHIENEFALLGLSPERFNACTSDDLPCFQLPWTIDDFVRELWTPGEIGCLLSHLAIWQQMIDEDIPAAAIFEDDVILGVNAQHVINELGFEQSPHIKKLETTYQFCFISTVRNGYFRELLSQHKGSAAYALNKSAARELISIIHKRPLRVDLAIFSPFECGRVKVEQAYPAVAIQECFLPTMSQNPAMASTLNEARYIKFLSMREGMLAKVRRWILNIFSYGAFESAGKTHASTNVRQKWCIILS